MEWSGPYGGIINGIQNLKINQDIKKEDEAIQDDQEEILMNEKEENEILKSMRYEYYIHYFGMDRRNDRWVTE